MNVARVFVLLWAAVAAIAPARAQPLPADLGERWITGYIRPASAALVAAASNAGRAVDAYCAAPADASLRDDLRTQIHALAGAWGRVAFLRFGPLVEANRFERLFFFPDPRGLVVKQTAAAIATAGAQPLDIDALRARSVAVQGLGALEYALFDGEAGATIARGEADGRARCAYARGVAAALQRTAEELAQGWQATSAFAREFGRPGKDNRLYRTSAEVAAEAIKASSGGIRFVRDIQLLPALGADAASARGQRLPLWRSGASAALLAGTIEGLRDFVAAGRLTPALAPEQRWVPAAFADEASRIAAQWRSLSSPLDHAIADSALRGPIELSVLQLKNLQDINDAYLAPALGVSIGFNAFDGD
ncbi:MAG TPA: imelysin family protein [Dokdonella sp.]|uniref:imelysin family protein n=1 Tax=Dokdonella sp. TaxID=2291710 RepID=UPI002BA812A9|nr:imelysin family protein [Dokdonella sp.]HUD41781.1 imelysin family protein [Dokdonella sp.]